MKVCTLCKEEKPLAGYYKTACKKYYTSACKRCTIKKTASYQKAHKDVKRKSNSNYRLKNRDKTNALARAYSKSEKKRLWVRKRIYDLSDSYIIDRLRQDGTTTGESKNNYELINIKRGEILIHRIKKIANGKEKT